MITAGWSGFDVDKQSKALKGQQPNSPNCKVVGPQYTLATPSPERAADEFFARK